MSDEKRDVKRVESLYGLVLDALEDHLLHGEPVFSKEGEKVGSKLNAQLVRQAIHVAERANVNVTVKPGSRAANLLKVAAEEVEGLEWQFPDETDPAIN